MSIEQVHKIRSLEQRVLAIELKLELLLREKVQAGLPIPPIVMPKPLSLPTKGVR